MSEARSPGSEGVSNFFLGGGLFRKPKTSTFDCCAVYFRHASQQKVICKRFKMFLDFYNQTQHAYMKYCLF